MGFFRNLWDEALAGPTPDSGVGKFRRYNSLFFRSNNINNNNNNNIINNIPPTADDNTPVSRTITILRTDSGSTPTSPTGSSSAGSPFSAASPGGDLKKLTRRKSTADGNRREPKSPTGYDWIVLTSLDR